MTTAGDGQASEAGSGAGAARAGAGAAAAGDAAGEPGASDAAASRDTSEESKGAHGAGASSGEDVLRRTPSGRRWPAVFFGSGEKSRRTGSLDDAVALGDADADGLRGRKLRTLGRGDKDGLVHANRGGDGESVKACAREMVERVVNMSARCHVE